MVSQIGKSVFLENVSTQCGHIYHYDCILKRMPMPDDDESQFSCPLCKKNITLLYPACYFPDIVSSEEDSKDDTLEQQAKYFQTLSLSYSKSAFILRYAEDEEKILSFETPKELIDYLLEKCADDVEFCESLKRINPNCQPKELLVPLHMKFPEIMGAIIKKEDSCGMCLGSLAGKNIKPYLGRCVKPWSYSIEESVLAEHYVPRIINKPRQLYRALSKLSYVAAGVSAAVGLTLGVYTVCRQEIHIPAALGTSLFLNTLNPLFVSVGKIFYDRSRDKKNK